MDNIYSTENDFNKTTSVCLEAFLIKNRHFKEIRSLNQSKTAKVFVVCRERSIVLKFAVSKSVDRGLRMYILSLTKHFQCLTES